MIQKFLMTSALVLGGVTGACAQQAGGNLVFLVQPEPPTLAIYGSTATPIALVSTKIYEGLLEYGVDLKPKPSLAESWSLSSDGLTLTFVLRKDVKFHDGKPFTSADAAFSIDTIRKVHPRGMGTFRDVSAIETPDDHTLVLKLAARAPYIMASLSSSETPMLPKHLLEGVPDVRMAKIANAPVGTGPFVFAKWERGQYILMEKNKNYWRAGRPYLDRLVARFVPDSSTRSALLKSGEVHMAGMGAVPYNDVKSLAESKAVEVTYKGVEMISPITELTLNTKKPPLDDKRVRQAISYAVDRKFVVDNIFSGAGKPASGPLSSNFTPSGYFTSDVLNYAAADRLNKARALLDEAGLKPGVDGVRFTLTHDVLPYGEEWRRFGEKLQQDLAQIGIKVTLRNEDVASWLRRVYTTYDFQITSNHLSNLSDPVLGVHRGIHSSYIKKGTTFVNASQWSSPETDALMDKATTEIDNAKRGALYRELQQKVVEAAPNVYVFELAYPTVVSKRVRNGIVGPLGLYESFADTWLDK